LRELVCAIARGDQPALHALYARTHRLVFTLSMRITSNRATAEELTLDVFHHVWRRAPAYDPANGPVIGWIMNQARSRAIDRLRFEQRLKRTNDQPGDPAQSTASDGPQEAFALKEQGRLLRHALQGLTPDERQAIETAFFSELTYRETAVRLNQPVGNREDANPFRTREASADARRSVEGFMSSESAETRSGLPGAGFPARAPGAAAG
jgi:RNA polymerase sigma-70 factor (ECF subfamily)